MNFFHRRITAVILPAILLVITVFAALLINGEISPYETFNVLCGHSNDVTVSTIIFELRIPRIIAAILCGAALGCAGAILQSTLHNPLASPDLLGISAGGGCAGIAVMIWLPSLINYLGIAVFLGASAVTLLIFLASGSRKLSPLRLIIAGVALGALFGTISTVIMMFGTERYSAVFNFLLGGFSGVSYHELKLFAPGLLISIIAALVLSKKLDILALGDDHATSLGLRVAQTRLTALSVAALGAASAAGIAGLLGFAGLIAPHTVRLLGKSGSNRIIIPGSAIAGAELVLAGDYLGQLLAPEGVEIPAGVFLSGCGALFFILLLINSREDMS